MNAFLKVCFGSLVVLAILAGYSLLSGFLVMICWNFAVVGAFGAPTLGFFQTWAIMFMLGVLGKQVFDSVKIEMS